MNQSLEPKEIEVKYLVEQIPFALHDYPSHEIEQGYLCKNPVVRVRRSDEIYTLTYKSKGLLERTEYNLALTQESYDHLIKKSDGNVITKTRYLIPYLNYTIEFDVFHGVFEGLLLAEIEFSSKEEALACPVPDWFGRDVTFEGSYQNSVLSGMDLSTVAFKPFKGTDTIA